MALESLCLIMEVRVEAVHKLVNYQEIMHSCVKLSVHCAQGIDSVVYLTFR